MKFLIPLIFCFAGCSNIPLGREVETIQTRDKVSIVNAGRNYGDIIGGGYDLTKKTGYIIWDDEEKEEFSIKSASLAGGVMTFDTASGQFAFDVYDGYVISDTRIE